MSVYSPSGSGEVHVDQVMSGKTGGRRQMPYEIRSESGRFCVYKKDGSSKMGCHDTRGEAEEQLAALHAREGGKMGETVSFLVGIESLNFAESDGDTKWVHALPLGEYQHPIYGKIKIDPDRAKRFADNVKSKVRGIDPSLNYNHDNDSPEGATGWVKDAEARSNGLWLFVEFVKDAAQKIREKKFKYFSIEFADEWVDAQGKKFKDVVMGGAITNRPFMKNLVPLNLSESVIDNAFDLVGAITGKDVSELKEDSMDQKDLDAIINGVTAKLKESFQPPKNTPAPNKVTELAEIEELKKLRDDNPVIGKLFEHFEGQATALEQQRVMMRETRVDAKLSEFDNSKLTLTPSTKELARELLLEMPDNLVPKMFEFMEQVRTSQSFLVELGQRSGASVRPGFDTSDRNATQEFMARANQLMAEGKEFLEAVSIVAAKDPALYELYRLGDGASKSA